MLEIKNDNLELKLFTLGLSRQKKIGIKTFKKLLADYGDIANLYLNYKNKNIAILDMNLVEDGEKTFSDLEKLNIQFCCIWEKAYPFLLKEIDDPSIIIYYKGDLDAFNWEKTISIVGTRNPSAYGKIYTEKFARELSEIGISVVSGLAFGIDSIAHLASFNKEGRTIAILPSSVDQAAPSTNKYLYDKIIANNGLIISPFPPGTIVKPGLFPARNRLIAGISKGTLIIEASEKSGALITAELAIDYNRDVFVIPGSLDNIMSVGSNSLLKKGTAKLIQSIDDITNEIFTDSILESENNPQIKENLNNIEINVYNAISNKPIFVDDLILKLENIRLSDLNAIISVLELKGYVKRESTGKYYK